MGTLASGRALWRSTILSNFVAVSSGFGMKENLLLVREQVYSKMFGNYLRRAFFYTSLDCNSREDYITFSLKGPWWWKDLHNGNN
jgi:hypothetical protein